MKKSLITVIGSLILLQIQAQETKEYDLSLMLKNGQLNIDTSNHTQELHDAKYPKAISTQKIAWLKNSSFKEGTIDVDLRGKDVFLQSFLGIAFHGTDTSHYELIYFRPFNFQHADTARRRWSVQYMVLPEFPYNKLRKEHPLVYENSIQPPPRADDWFHASIVVKAGTIAVYVNHEEKPSLEVKRLRSAGEGMVGLWDDELSGDFANLVISSVAE